MSKIIKVVALNPADIAHVQALENYMGTQQGLYEKARKDYYDAMEILLKKFDPMYQQNRANQANVYRGQIADGSLVITLE